MSVKIHPSWLSILKDEFEQEYFQSLIDFVSKEYRKNRCYPPGKQIFAAFDYCPLDRVRVVIIGQDPYHGEGQANGLCFSVNENQPHPPSLVNIFKEICTDCKKEYPKSGNLESWSRQGVLLLNATLTVRASDAGSHQNKGWEVFTDSVIQKLSTDYSHLVFMLWGGHAKNKARFIDAQKHLILRSGHPSPLSANRGLWFGNKHFSKCNQYLLENNDTPIDW